MIVHVPNTKHSYALITSCGKTKQNNYNDDNKKGVKTGVKKQGLIVLVYEFMFIHTCRGEKTTTTIQILYSLRITTCNQHEVHYLTPLFYYNNTKWLVD